MQEQEINAIITQLEAEFKAKYPFMDVLLRKQRTSKIYGLSAQIKYKGKSTYYSFSFTENLTEATLRRHIYAIVNKKGEEYARREKELLKKSKSII